MHLLVLLFIAVSGFSLSASAQQPPVGTPFGSASQGQTIPSLAPLVKKVTPGVVNIAIKGRITQEQNPLLKDPFFRRFFDVPELPAEREIRAAGSGVIIDAGQGLVVTNNHMVEHADEIAVTLTDGRRLQAKRVGSDPDADIAIIKVPAEALTAIVLGDSDKLEVGDFAVAVGNPFGLGQTVTLGIVSALRRTGLGIKNYEDFIQTDAPINPGNSGGALINLRGELIGINTAIVGPSGGNVGIGFAIPINMVREIADQLTKYGEVRRGQLGVTVQDLTPDLAQAMGLAAQQTGAAVVRVEPGSAAERAGLKAGDIITSIGTAAVRNSADVRNRIGLLRVDDAIELAVLRAGKPMVIHATVAAPEKKLIQGKEASSLLEGAVFGPVGAGARVRGVEIVSIRAGSRAAMAGLQKGDIVTAINQEPVTGPDDFVTHVKASPKRLLLTLVRDGSALFLVLQ